MLYFWGGLGLESAAADMGISFGRVAQLLRVAKKDL